MLCANNYAKEYIDACRTRVASQIAAYASLIVDFYLRLVPSGRDLLDPDLIVRQVGDIVAALPAETRAMLTQRDQAQLEAVLDYLEGWWAALSGEIVGGGDPPLELLVRSRFFEVTHDEGALTRFALEARLSAMVFGAEPTAALLARVAAMERATTAAVQRVLTAHAGGVDGAIDAVSARAGR